MVCALGLAVKQKVGDNPDFPQKRKGGPKDRRLMNQL
jgi:hypothetical protein